MKDTVVIDLDGTLADLTHRLPLIQQKRPKWDDFFLAVSGDAIHDEIRQLVNMFHAGEKHRVLIVSARPITTKAATVKWLWDHQVFYDELVLLRGEKDYTPDDELKVKWLESYGANRILFVVDDRQRVVDMWRAKGVVCLQCRAWKEWKK